MSNAAQDRKYRTQKQQRLAKGHNLSPRWLARSIARNHKILGKNWKLGVEAYMERKEQQNQVRKIVRRRKPSALNKLKMEDA